jgi:LPS sulfotransferase NodH
MSDDSDESASVHEAGVHGESENVHREPQMSEALSHILVALDNGDTGTAIRLFDEACEKRFEAGIGYAKDMVQEWYGR